jgi:hypothetical protein
MSNRWSAGTFLAKALELRRRLRVWHNDDFLGPIQTASQRESCRWVRLTFREIFPAGDPSPRPESWQFFTDAETGEPAAEPVRNPDRDTDRSLTQWLLNDFHRHLDAADPCPALDYLRESFGHLLDLPAWTVREYAKVFGRPVSDSDPDKHGDPRIFGVSGRPVPPDFLDALVNAAEKLWAAAPPGWGAPVRPAPPADPGIQPPSGAVPAGANEPDSFRAGLCELRRSVAWLKRVTPDWPPMGIDWPWVLSRVERLWLQRGSNYLSEREQPGTGQELSDFMGQHLSPIFGNCPDPVMRAYAFSSLLLDVVLQLDAFGRPSLAVGDDLDTIPRPVQELPPFHALMVLGWPLAEMVQAVVDVGGPDFEAVPTPAPQPVQVGGTFDVNAHRAVLQLAREICEVRDSATGGRLLREGRGSHPEGAIEDAWFQFCRAMVGRLPDATSAKRVKAQLEAESRSALDARSQAAGGPDGVEAAHQAVDACLSAAMTLRTTARSSAAGVCTTERAMLACIFRLDSALCQVRGRPVDDLFGPSGAHSATVAAARSAWEAFRQGVADFRASPEAPADGWHSLWDIYFDQFKTVIAPWSLGPCTNVEIDAGGPLHPDPSRPGMVIEAGGRARANVVHRFTFELGPPDRPEHPWHRAAWPSVCQRLVELPPWEPFALRTQMEQEYRKRLAQSADETGLFPGAESGKAAPSTAGGEPSRMGCRPSAAQHQENVEATKPFIPTELQERVLGALNGKALTLDALAVSLEEDRSRLHRDAIKELMERGKVKNHRRVGGYYRPDALPPKYADLLREDPDRLK